MACKSQKKDCPCNRCRLGWYSRRHETREAQDAAYVAFRDRAANRPRQCWDINRKCWVPA